MAVSILVLAAEDVVDDFHGRAHGLEWVEPQDLGAFQGGDAFVGVFVEQRGRARHGPVRRTW